MLKLVNAGILGFLIIGLIRFATVLPPAVVLPSQFAGGVFKSVLQSSRDSLGGLLMEEYKSTANDLIPFVLPASFSLL